MNFGKRLCEERKRIGLNQTDFGRIGGVTKTSQVNYESGERSPNVDYWQAIGAVGADVQYILTGLRSGVQVTQYQLNKEEAEQLILSMRERALIDNYRHIDDEDGKRYVEQSAQLAAKAIKDEAQSGKEKKRAS